MTTRVDRRKSHLPSLQERLAAFSQPHKSGCVLWTGARTSRGYGRIMLAGSRRMVHQLVWERAHGPLPAGRIVRHRCDNPQCVKLDHLEAGTQTDNVADMDSRGRRGRQIGPRPNHPGRTLREGERDERGRFSTTVGLGDRGSGHLRKPKGALPQVLS